MLSGDLTAKAIDSFFKDNINPPAEAKKKGKGIVMAIDKSETPLTRWKELQQTGYLLASAYREKPTQPPERVAEVQQIRDYIKKVETFEKALKKGDKNEAKTSYMAAKESLETYLKSVDIRVKAAKTA